MKPKNDKKITWINAILASLLILMPLAAIFITPLGTEGESTIATMTGESQNDHFGWNVSSAGDMNGDGFDDIIVGAPGYDNNRGRAYIFFGGPWFNGDLLAENANVTLNGSTQGDKFGWDVSGAKDANNDKFEDVIVGAPGNNSDTGAVYIFFGNNSMPTLINAYDANVTIYGERQGDEFGSSVSDAGNVNNDDYNDLIVGAPYYSEWWDTAWSYRKRLTFDNSGQSESLVNFPVLVNLSSSNFDYAKAELDGRDLRFIDADGVTELTYHIEEWNTSGASYVWVNVTNIVGGSSTDYMWMYYGNPLASDIQDVSGTYNTNYVGVWHLNETSGTHFDATSNDNHGSPGGGVTQDATGIIDGADEFDGANAYVNCGNDSSLNITDEITIEAWLNASENPASGAIIDALDIDTNTTDKPDIIHVTDNIFAIAYKGGKGGINFGNLTTVEIFPNGTINDTLIDRLMFDPWKGDNPDIIHVAGNIFAIAYKDFNNFGNLKTVEIFPNGTINDTIIDGLVFDPWKGDRPKIIYVAGNIFAIAYKDFNNFGNLTTVEIFPNGTISDTVIDRFVFDPWKGDKPDIVHVTGNIFAIAYKDVNNFGNLTTVEIFPNGTINDTVIDRFLFDAIKGDNPDIIPISGNIFAIAYKDVNNFGNLTTVEIFPNGIITDTVRDRLVFDPIRGDVPAITHVYDNVFAIAYKGLDNDGYLEWVEIANDGSIVDTVLGALEFDTDNCNNPDIIHIAEDISAIVYKGQNNNVSLRTVERFVNNDIVGAEAYGMAANAETAGGSINEQTIYGAISKGWNHIVLTYDKDAGEDQIKLYINGILMSSETLSDAIAYNIMNLTIGKNFLGKIDEVRISNIARSADWISAQYLSMDNRFITYGPEEAQKQRYGAIYVFYGSPDMNLGPIYAADANVSIFGSISDELLGFSVSGTGDMNGDNNDELLMGAPGTDKAYVFLGMANLLGHFVASESSLTINGTVGEGFGWSVSGAGDVDNDEYDDVIIGAPQNNSAQGSAYIFTGTYITTESTADRYIDLTAGDNAYVTLTGVSNDDLFGYSVSYAGNLNNDGCSDVIVGAPNALVNGSIYVFFGSPSMNPNIPATNNNFTMQKEKTTDRFGWSVSCAGNVDNDTMGYEEIIVGAPYFDDGSSDIGKVYVNLFNDIVIPGIVSGVSIIDYSSTSVMLTWDAASEGGSGFKNYTIFYDTNPNVDANDVTWSYVSQGNLTSNLTTYAEITDLSPATTYYFKIIVYDNAGNNGSFEDALEISFIPPSQNYPPTILGVVPNQEKIEDSPPWSLNLNAYGSDFEDMNSDLKWFITGEDTSLYTVIGENTTNMLTFIPVSNAYGNDEATLWLMDSEGAFDSQKLWINITPDNDKPYFNPSPPNLIVHYYDASISENDPYTWNYTAYAHDVETQPSDLIFTTSEDTTDLGNGYITVDGMEATFCYPYSMLGKSRTVTLKLSDGEDETTTIITIKISSNWAPRLVEDLPDITLEENSTLINVLDLDDYFWDRDNDTLFFASGHSHIEVSIRPDHTVDFISPEDWFGVEYVTFRATDPTGAIIETTIVVTVISVNDPPVIAGVPDITVHFDHTFAFDLSPYVNDRDNSTDELTVWISEPQNNIWVSSKSNLILMFNYPEARNGEVIPVVILVSDGIDENSQSILVRVTDNYPPEVKWNLPDVSFNEDESMNSAFDLDFSFGDMDDGDVLSYTYESTYLLININNNHTVDFQAPPDWYGSEKITFRATDPSGAIVEDTIIVTVIPVNDAPIIEEIPDQQANEGDTWILDLSSYISDIDNEHNDLEVTVRSSEGEQYISVSGFFFIFQYPEGVKNDTITVTVSDGISDSSRTFSVTLDSLKIKKSDMDNNLGFWALLLVICIIIAELIVYRLHLGRFRVHEVFSIHKNGLIIAHTTEETTGSSKTAGEGGMLVAGMNLIRESIEGSTAPSSKKRMKVMGKYLIVEEGKMMYVIVVHSGDVKKRALEQIKNVVDDAETRHWDALQNWQGDPNDLKGIEDCLRTLLDKPGKAVMPLSTDDLPLLPLDEEGLPLPQEDDLLPPSLNDEELPPPPGDDLPPPSLEGEEAPPLPDYKPPPPDEEFLPPPLKEGFPPPPPPDVEDLAPPPNDEPQPLDEDDLPPPLDYEPPPPDD